jgi:methyltransferase family protein
VLELGSFDVNGSVRPLFADRAKFPSYLGIDARPGPGVDLVMDASKLVLNDRFNIVVTTEMLEHAVFWLVLSEAWRVLIPGGWIIITTRGIGYPRHDYPSDYYRFTKEGLDKALELSGFRVIESEEHPTDKGVFAFAEKP